MLYLRSNYYIHDCKTAIEGEFGDLSSRKLAIGVSKFHNCSILHIGRTICAGADTVVSSLLDLVVDRQAWVLQMNCLGNYQTRRELRCIFCQEKLPSLIAIAPSIT